MTSNNVLKQGTHFSLIETGSCDNWPNYTVELPGLEIPGKLFLKESLQLTGCEISINAMPAGQGMPIYHSHHKNEEVYIFLSGKGQVQVDNETMDVSEGSILRISPKGERIWRNTGNDDLVYIIIQVKNDSLEEYGIEDATIPEKAANW